MPKGLPPWWIINKVQPEGPEVDKGSWKAVSFSEAQQKEFGVDAEGTVTDQAKYDAKIDALKAARLATAPKLAAAPDGTTEMKVTTKKAPGRQRSRSPARGRQDASLVPIIDIGALSNTSADAEAKAAREKVAQEICTACGEIGFFVVINHGIPKDVVEAVWAQTRQFFDLPLEEKQTLTTDDDSKYPYGYSALGGETLSRGKRVDGGADEVEETKPAGDMKEMMQIGPCNAESGMPPRRMPTNPEGFAPAWERYYEEANSLAGRLLGAFAISLGLPANWFDNKKSKHISALRANNYPDQKDIVVPPGSIRCSAHTDYGTVTILKSGGPGLQVCKDKQDSVWHDVPYVPDGFVINLGDLMRRWTNDRWSSTLHRVINPPPDHVQTWGRRMGLAFFHNLDKDAIVETIPSCITESNPLKYDPIVAGEFLMLKHLASNGKADPDAHMKTRGGASARGL